MDMDFDMDMDMDINKQQNSFLIGIKFKNSKSHFNLDYYSNDLKHKQ